MTLLRSVVFLLACSVLTGCMSAGYAGAHPAEITCKGKGVISGQGSAQIASGNFSIQADCGDGFQYRQIVAQ